MSVWVPFYGHNLADEASPIDTAHKTSFVCVYGVFEVLYLVEIVNLPPLLQAYRLNVVIERRGLLQSPYGCYAYALRLLCALESSIAIANTH